MTAALSFERGDLSVHQVVAVSPGARHGLPLVRRGVQEAMLTQR